MAKKTSNRVSPPLKRAHENRFDNLKAGDCFIDASNDLLMKTDDDAEQSGISLITGIVYSELCLCQVMPVDVTITWKKK